MVPTPTADIQEPVWWRVEGGARGEGGVGGRRAGGVEAGVGCC